MPPLKKGKSTTNTLVSIKIDPLECPFREFRDNELSPDYWGMNSAAYRTAASMYVTKSTGKQPGHASTMQPLEWEDDQVQPLPKSVRHYLDSWVRAEELAYSRWGAEVTIFNEVNWVGKMSVVDYQLSHAQVLLRSSFCRQVLSACFNLEKVEGMTAEHQWENFNISYGPEGWRAWYHIYSPGVKAGGGTQHRPSLSKAGCYLVRLYYLGAWRCVWVDDHVPVDASGAPLLPFSPMTSPSPVKGRNVPAMVTSNTVHLWPLLICKALLKLAAPDMNSDEDVCPEEDENILVADEPMAGFDLMHALTGGFSLMHIASLFEPNVYEDVWKLLYSDVKVFNWDDDYEDGQSSTTKSRSTRKPNAKDKDKDKTSMAMTFVSIEDTKDLPPYALPGITPALEMSLIVTMVRDVPLKRPLPEPDVAQWKHYRWIEWARRHGLYANYECPRTKFLKVNGLMKLSYAPHLLDVQSTESITRNFREEQEKDKVPTDRSIIIQ